MIVCGGDFNIGNKNVNILPGGSLILYVYGDIKISGNGSFNNQSTHPSVSGAMGLPQNLIIFGTRKMDEAPQSFTVSGNGVLSAAVYAPNADVTANGGGSSGAVYGAIVSRSITVHGSPGPFHADKNLGQVVLLEDYEVVDYKVLSELVGTEDVKPTVNETSTTFKDMIAAMFSTDTTGTRGTGNTTY